MHAVLLETKWSRKRKLKISGPEHCLQQSTSSFPWLREPQDVWTPVGSGEEQLFLKGDLAHNKSSSGSISVSN